KNFTVVVPTGNFGNIFAGWMAKEMGLPIKRLILATNANDILYRFIKTGIYNLGEVMPTLSPSMDIQLASNFERYLYYLNDRNPQQLKGVIAEFTTSGKLTIGSNLFEKITKDFAGARVDDQAILATIKDVWQKTDYILDPHTATGVSAAQEYQRQDPTSSTMVCLATAHPAKFPDAVEQAIGAPPPVPPAIAALEKLPCRFDLIKADSAVVKAYIMGKLKT
ncbi:MAG: threonine synthase, partial [Deltaproteobacteria bacterium]|nr:threonine synthase [Deltaproteobacteria bacterium]